MTTPMYEVEIFCDRCGTEYSDWRRDSVNLSLSPNLSQQEIDDQLTTKCPTCGLRDTGLGLIVGNELT